MERVGARIECQAIDIEEPESAHDRRAGVTFQLARLWSSTIRVAAVRESHDCHVSHDRLVTGPLVRGVVVVVALEEQSASDPAAAGALRRARKPVSLSRRAFAGLATGGAVAALWFLRRARRRDDDEEHGPTVEGDAVVARSQLHPLTLLLIAVFASCVRSARLIDDRAITIHSGREVVERRRALIQYLWGPDGFPARLPDLVLTNVASPVKQLSHLTRVDELRIDMAPGLQGLAYHFIPERPNRELVIVHQGHACTLDDDPSPEDVGFGLQRTIHALLREGYGVLGVFMPHMRPGDCAGGHDAMFKTHTTGSPIKYFLEPTAVSLNYLETCSRAGHFPEYRAFHMTGVSGGGWTTTIYAAIDPRIRCSVPVAGTTPLYLRSGDSVGDREQYEPTFYRIAGYQDLYIMGAHEHGRKQVQILVRRDDCCFGEAQHDAKSSGMAYADAMRDYEQRVRVALEGIGRGSFRVEIDEIAPSHMISHHAIEDVLLPELRSARR